MTFNTNNTKKIFKETLIFEATVVLFAEGLILFTNFSALFHLPKSLPHKSYFNVAKKCKIETAHENLLQAYFLNRAIYS